MGVEALFETAQNELTDLNKMLIESCAQMAYNNVIFESALSLTEAEDEKEAKEDKDPSKFKNNLYKALETVKRFAATLFAKIKVAINEFVAKQTSNHTKKAIEAWLKDNDLSANSVVTVDKFIGLDNPATVFGAVGFTFIDGKSEEEGAKAIAAVIAKALGGNYAEAKKALADAASFADVSKVLNNLVSYAEGNEKAKWTAEEFIKTVPDLGLAKNLLKEQYNNKTAECNKRIKDLKDSINTVETADAVASVKAEIAKLNKFLGLIQASFIGFMKWYVAVDRQALSVIKSAKKGGVNEASMEFMGLALL